MTATPAHLIGTPNLEHLRVEGAIFLRAEYTEGWAFEAFDGPTTASVLQPGADRVTLFHVVASGTCWIEVEGDKHWAESGDVIVLPYGDLHRLGGVEPAEMVSLATFLTPPPWTEFPVLKHGAGGTKTDFVCGYIYSRDPLFDPALRALPPVFIVRPDDAAARWVRASIDYAMAATSGTNTKIPELLLAEVLRLHLATNPAMDHGWLGALDDPVLAPALAELHAAPEHKWTVADLAGKVAVSRSQLDSKFRQVLGRSPIRYLTEWRMHVAADLLRTSDTTVFDVARRVGYDSEEAFSRAFKRARGVPPSAWRTAPAS